MGQEVESKGAQFRAYRRQTLGCLGRALWNEHGFWKRAVPYAGRCWWASPPQTYPGPLPLKGPPHMKTFTGETSLCPGCGEPVYFGK